MLWIALSLVSAMAQVARNATMKRLGHELDEYINVLGRFVFILPFAAAVAAAREAPAIRPDFLWACLLFGICQTAGTIALSKALLYGNIGMVTSLWKTSIVWLVILAFFTLGEVPSWLGLAGIAVAMVGVYGLNASRARISFWEPIRVLFTDRGLRYTLLSGLLYAPAVVTFKWAALASNGPVGTLGTYSAAALCTLPIALWKSARHFRQIPRLWKGFVGLGLFAAINSLALAEAYQMTLTSYVESVKHTEILFAILAGYLFFGERERLMELTAGGSLILGGILLLVLGG
ncbi:MAG: DMT family transporter [bacterium]